MVLFKKEVTKRDEKEIVIGESKKTVEKENTKLALNEEEKRMLEYFDLNFDFSYVDLENACDKKKNNYEDESKIIYNKEIAELLLYKKQKVDETMDLFPMSCNLENSHFVHYDVVNKLEDGRTIIEKKSFIKSLCEDYETEILSENIKNSKNKKDVDKACKEYSLEMIRISSLFERDELSSYEEYIKRRKEEQISSANYEKIFANPKETNEIFDEDTSDKVVTTGEFTSDKAVVSEKNSSDNEKMVDSYRQLFEDYVNFGFLEKGTVEFEKALKTYCALKSHLASKPNELKSEYGEAIKKLNEIVGILDETPKKR